MTGGALDIGPGLAPGDAQQLVAMFTAKTDRHGGTLGAGSDGGTARAVTPSPSPILAPEVVTFNTYLTNRPERGHNTASNLILAGKTPPRSVEGGGVGNEDGAASRESGSIPNMSDRMCVRWGRRLGLAVLAACLGLAAVRPARADLIILKGGFAIQGQVRARGPFQRISTRKPRR